VEHTVGQATHLGVATLLAGVFAQSVGKGDYLLERPHDSAVEGAAAGVAASQVGSYQGQQFAGAAHRAGKAARPGRSSARWNFCPSHFSLPPCLSGTRGKTPPRKLAPLLLHVEGDLSVGHLALFADTRDVFARYKSVT
jgi:hypothetical protein